jgi:FtsH-binding integral membrane protein
MSNAYETPHSNVVSHSMPEERAAFIRRTYAHLAGAVALFVVLEYFLLQSEAVVGFMLSMLTESQYGWLMVMGGFILVGWMGRSMARSIASPAMQYLGLGLFVLGEAIIFVPLMYLAMYYSSPDVLPTAAFLTTVLFGGLTTYALTTRKDFSFLSGILTIGGFVALGVIVAAVIFGFTLGLFFSAAMIVLASGAILYDTSKIVHEFRTDQHVAASLELFASVAMLFWYMIRLLMSLSNR